MSIAVLGVELPSAASGTTLTIPVGATGMVLVFSEADDLGPQSGGTMTIGGVECPNLCFDTTNGAVSGGGGIWWCPDFSGRSNDVLSWTDASPGITLAVIYFSARVPMTRDVNPLIDSYGSNNVPLYQNSDASLPVAGGNQLAVVQRFHDSGTISTVAGTELWGGWKYGAAYDLGGRDEAVSAGCISTGGHNFWDWYMGATIYESDIAVEIQPATTPSIVVTVPAVGIAGPGDIFTWATPAVLEVTVPKAQVRVDRPLTIPLVGQHSEMPARMPYPDGYTTPVVTHDGVRPVWTEGTNIVPERTRMVPLTTTGTSGDPELVWDDDDQLIMTEYYE